MLGDAAYVYGVWAQKGQELPSEHGVQGAELQAVEHAGLVALISRLHHGRLAAQDLRAHWRVLEQAFARTTVLPVRFGTVMESDRDVRERLLEPNAERLSALLEEMKGLVQLSVKGRYDEDMLLRQIVEENPAIARLREDVGSDPAGAFSAAQIRLGELVEGEVARHREQDAELALEALAPAAVGTRAEQVAHPDAFDLAFLVERSREATLSRAVRTLRKRLGPRIELRYVGPLPPFSFAEADLSTVGGPWA